MQGSIYEFGPYLLDPERGLSHGGVTVHLPPKELALLSLLVRHQGGVVSQLEVDRHIWPRQVVSYASIGRCVYSLRRLLGDRGRGLIKTVPKRGFRITAPVRKMQKHPSESALSQCLGASPVAISHYFAGMREHESLQRDAMPRALSLFEAALREDPGFAPAHAALADTRIFQALQGEVSPCEGLELGLKACKRALDINPSLVQALAAMSWFESVILKEFAIASERLDWALSIDPNYARGYCYGAWLALSRGQPEVAIAAARRAVELDPHARFNRYSLAWALFCGGQCDHALDQLHRWCVLYPYDDTVQGYVAIMAAYLGRREEALAACTRLMAASHSAPSVSANCVYALAKSGEAAKARRLAERMGLAVAKFGAKPQVAAACLETGNAENAFKLLEEARAECCPWLGLARFDPRYSGISDNERFNALFAE